MRLTDCADHYRTKALECDKEITLINTLDMPTELLLAQRARIEQQRDLWHQLAAEIDEYLHHTGAPTQEGLFG